MAQPRSEFDDLIPTTEFDSLIPAESEFEGLIPKRKSTVGTVVKAFGSELGQIGRNVATAPFNLLSMFRPPEPEPVIPAENTPFFPDTKIGPRTEAPSILTKLAGLLSPQMTPQDRARVLRETIKKPVTEAAKTVGGFLLPATGRIEGEGMTPEVKARIVADVASYLIPGAAAKILKFGRGAAPAGNIVKSAEQAAVRAEQIAATKAKLVNLKFTPNAIDDAAERLSFEQIPPKPTVPVKGARKVQRFNKYEREFETLPRTQKTVAQMVEDADIAPNTLQKDLKFSAEAATPTKTFKSFMDAVPLEGQHGYFASLNDWFSAVEKRLMKVDYGRQLLSRLKEVAPLNANLLGDVEDIMHRHGFKRGFFGKPAFSKLTQEEATNLHLVLQGGAESLTSNVAKMAPAMREVYDYLFRQAQKAGFEDLRYIKDFQPRMLKQEILERVYNYATQVRVWAQQVLREELKDPDAVLQNEKQLAEIINRKTAQMVTPDEFVRQFVEHYKASDFGKSTGEALADLSKWAKSEYKMPFGSLDYGRKAKFPTEWYENDARLVFDKYIRRASKRVAEAAWLGVNGEKGQLLQRQIAATDVTLGHLSDTVLKRMLWIEDIPKDKVAESFANFNAAYQYATKVVPSALVYAQQPLQPFISFFNEVGYRRGFKAFFKTIFDKDAKNLARRSGVAETDVFEAATGLAANRRLAQVIRDAGAGFGWLNIINKKWAFTAYNDFIHELHNLANNPAALRGGWARKTLDEMGVDFTKPLVPDDVLRVATRLATDSQLQKNLLLEPEFLSRPGLRALFVLKRFTTKQFIWQKDLLLKEARKGNALPILRAGLSSVGTGELFIWLKDKYKSALRGENVYREEDARWKRLVNDVAAASTFGWVGSLAGAALTEGAKGASRQAGFLLTPALPFGLVPEEIATAGEKIGGAEGLKDKTIAAVKYIVGRQLPLTNDLIGYRYLTDTDSKVLVRKKRFNDKIKEAAKEYFLEKDTAQARRIIEIWNRNNPYQDRIIPPWQSELNEKGEPFDDLTAYHTRSINSRVAQQEQLIRIMTEGLQNKK